MLLRLEIFKGPDQSKNIRVYDVVPLLVVKCIVVRGNLLKPELLYATKAGMKFEFGKSAVSKAILHHSTDKV